MLLFLLGEILAYKCLYLYGKCYIIACLFSSTISQASSKFFDDQEIAKAQNFGSVNSKIEDFFQENPTEMWMSICNHEYDYQSSSFGDLHHKQAAVVRIIKQDNPGGDAWGWFALFPNDESSMKQIYKRELVPEFNDMFGTPFSCYIKFYCNSEQKFLVLDFISVFLYDRGKGFSQFVTDAFIKFAKNHTNAQHILCDARNPAYAHISKKFGFVLDNDNPLWAYFNKGVDKPYVLDLTK